MDHAVTPLHCGTVTLDKSILTTQVDSGVAVAAPSICYLIEGPSAAEPILVDTSFGDVERMAELQPAFDCRRPHGHTVENRLNAHGYEVGDVETVVLTHLHWDHCYNLGRFEATAEIRVSRAELEYAVAPYPMHAAGYDAKSLGRVPPWLDVHLDPLEGEVDLAPGVTVFPTPGHTVGHVSLAVETADGTTVVAADAVPTFENLAGTADAPYVRGLAVNDFDWWHSAREVDERADVVLPGHEWEILDVEAPPDAAP
jgi:glyoxylase-like metal-dependent hydrolase (beta-lactamase superfamily II)